MPITRHPFLPPSGGDDWLQRLAVDDVAAAQLRASFEIIRSRASRIASSFYGTLFRRFPGLRATVPSDASSQERALLDFLTLVIEHLSYPQRTSRVLRERGMEYARRGALHEHYTAVSGMLLRSMASETGPEWNDQLTAEWEQALALVSQIMQQHASVARGSNLSQGE